MSAHPPIGRCLLGGLLVLALGVCLYSLALGPPWIPFDHLLAGLRGRADDPLLALSLREVRLPRTVLALTVGAGLAVGGQLVQTLTGNPLATPSILGITSGAALGLVLAVATVDGLSEARATLASFAGAACSAACIAGVGLGRERAVHGDSLVVAGSILGAFFGSIVTAVVFFNSLQNELLGWTLGRLVHVDWVQVRLAAPSVALGIGLALLVAGRLDALRLGALPARGLGVPVEAVRLTTVLAVVLVTGGSVAAAGPVAFVGLIVPHLLRTAHLGPRARLTTCALLGGTLTCLADVLARLTSSTRIVPLGIWTMAIGSLFFLGLGLRAGGRRES